MRGFTSLARCVCKLPPSVDCPLRVKLSDAKRACPFMKNVSHVDQELVSEMAPMCPVMSKMPSSVTIENDTEPGESVCDYKAESRELMRETYETKFEENITKLHAEGRYRYFANLKRHCGSFPQATYRSSAESSDLEIRIFCSNDYLGMGQHPTVLSACHSALEEAGAGAGGTRNISGNTRYHVELEHELASLHDKESALVMTSCFVANEAALGVMGKLLPDLLILSDAGNHASMIEGIRHSKCEKQIYKHNDLNHLEQLLAAQPIERPKMIVFESVYSMSGSISDIAATCTLAKKYNALTFLDEVHAVGMYGDQGAGVAEQEGVMDMVDIISGTLGKAYGVGGGYIAGSKSYVDCVRSFAPGFIFTTAIAPVIAAGALASVKHLKTSKIERATQHLRAKQLKIKLRQAGLPVMDNPSHIVPVLVGDPIKCKALTDALLFEHKVYLQPINYPTVDRGTERIRITPGPLHSEADLDYLTQAIDAQWTLLGLPRYAIKTA